MPWRSWITECLLSVPASCFSYMDSCQNSTQNLWKPSLQRPRLLVWLSHSFTRVYLQPLDEALQTVLRQRRQLNATFRGEKEETALACDFSKEKNNQKHRYDPASCTRNITRGPACMRAVRALGSRKASCFFSLKQLYNHLPIFLTQTSHLFH